MEIKTFEELKPFIAYIFHTENPNAYDYSSPRKSWDNSWIKRCASDYVKLVSDTMGVDYDTLLKDLETNESELYSNSSGHMSSKKCFIHHFNKKPEPVYAVRVSVDTYHGQVTFTDITKGYFRSMFECLWDTGWDFKSRYTKPFSTRQINCYEGNNKVGFGPATMIDSVHFCLDLDMDTDGFYAGGYEALQSLYKGKKYVGCNVGYTYNEENLDDDTDSYANCEILKFFTTEDEAKAYVAEWKNRKLSKSKACIAEENRIESTYGEILSRVRKLTKDEVVELKRLIEDIYNQKVADAKLNPLELCYEYMDSATEIEPYLISDCALRDWFDENYDANRYELVEYSSIFDRIMESYEDYDEVKWKNIKKKDKDLIKELAECFQNGIKGFKVDW